MTTNNAANFGTGTSGQVLTSNGAGVAPTFQAAAAGGVTGPGSSTNLAIATWNGTGGTALLNNSTVTISSTGVMQQTAQPCFSAWVTSNKNSVTGDGTIYTVIFDTKYFDQATNYSTSTGLFTAPVTGKYLFTTNICVSGLLVAHTSFFLYFAWGSSFTEAFRLNPIVQAISGNFSCSTSIIVSLASGSTCGVQVTVSGGTKVVNVNGGGIGATESSSFTGCLLC